MYKKAWIPEREEATEGDEQLKATEYMWCDQR
jgi:hypothetical protein